MKIKGLNFKCTCDACPEQYNVYLKEEQVGYVRLRWGSLTCDYPDVYGEKIYEVNIGDSLCGSFENDAQRMTHLGRIADKILEKMCVPKTEF